MLINSVIHVHCTDKNTIFNTTIEINLKLYKYLSEKQQDNRFPYSLKLLISLEFKINLMGK